MPELPGFITVSDEWNTIRLREGEKITVAVGDPINSAPPTGYNHFRMDYADFVEALIKIGIPLVEFSQRKDS